MTLKDFKDAMEAARRDWHLERGERKRLYDAWQELARQLADAEQRTFDANKLYRERKEEWRIARDWKLSSLLDVLMVMKLRGGAKR